ncbi:chromatin assembly factor 1 subunit A-domain-containing protein [Lipomyces kononenkoae]|uniref:Chromatin assembly factor 1 subunit A-domain-containing protein n=1 Tax=Lipomyces kononenkoae TaxID=34357 RepID=A0ACC3T2V3_LIPKO
MEALTNYSESPSHARVSVVQTGVVSSGNTRTAGQPSSTFESHTPVPAMPSTTPAGKQIVDIESSPVPSSPDPNKTLAESASNGTASEPDGGSAKKRKRGKLTEEEKAERENIRKKKTADLEMRKAVKAAKDTEKEEKRRAKEEEKRAKEEEKRKKEDAIKQKDKQQLRLGSFFNKKPTLTVTSWASEMKEHDDAKKSDYEEVFLPFHVRANTTLYPETAFDRDGPAHDAVCQSIERLIAQLVSAQSGADSIVIPEAASSPPNFTEIMGLHPFKLRTRGKAIPHTAKDVVSLFNSAHSEIPTTNSISEKDSSWETRLRAALRSLPRKFLRFCEDIRPPYNGTFTKTRRIKRNNPFFRDPCQNYDYDSEAEWVQEDEEIGEDLEALSNDSEEDGESAAGDFIDDEMNDFVVAEDEDKPRRRILAPLLPVAKGVCWTDLNTGINAEFDGTGLQIATIHPTITLPIDPFKDYGQEAKASLLDARTSTNKTPFQPSSTNNVAPASTRPFTMRISENDLKDILVKIQGSDMTQLMLIETLKKEFKSISKENIRLTVKEVAKRVGDREADKRWIIDSEVWNRYIGQSTPN